MLFNTPLTMFLRILAAILFLTVFPLVSYSQYQVNDRCLEAWKALIDLRVETARKLIAQEISEKPTNYYAYYLDQMCDAYALVINGSQEMYDDFCADFEKRREFMEEKDTESPYYLLCEAEMYLHMAAFGVMYGDRISGVRKGFKSYKKVYDNIENFPGFYGNDKLDGFYNIAISNLPPFVKWAAGAFGVKGDAETGFDMLHRYFESTKGMSGLNAEAALYLLLSYKLNKEPLKAFNFIKDQDSSVVDLRIVKYFYANTAYRSGFNDIAFASISNFNPDEAEIFFLPYDYMMGKILLRKLDDRSGYHLKRYLDLNKKDSYVKEITYKLGLSYLVKGDLGQFEYYKEKSCDDGADVNERDRETIYDCELNYNPDILLTKSRLLFEGGYYDRFGDIFYTINYNENSPLPYQLEYTLLKARYEEILGNRAIAETDYKVVITGGEDEDYYFASEAALRLGLMLLKSDTERAKDYLEMAGELYDSDYYEYIDEIAKRELKKLED